MGTLPRVFWAFMKDRHGAVYEESFDSYSEILEYTAKIEGFHRLKMRSWPIAHGRNAACQAFWNVTEIAGRPIEQSPDDTLVMIDADHVMQEDIIVRLAEHKEGVVCALATSRGDVPFLCFFGRGSDGNLYNLSEWEDGELVEGIVGGSGAIAIKRWVLQKLEHLKPSWFRYTYGGYPLEPTEEMFFGYECAKAGIPHYCDTKLWIPHCTVAYTTPEEWRRWFKDHPNIRAKVEVPLKLPPGKITLKHTP